MGRPGELYDQDVEVPDPASWGPPVRAGRGVLYDQDASVDQPRVDPRQEARHKRELYRRRDRELELARELEPRARRERADRRSTAEPPGHPSTPALRISSRTTPLHPVSSWGEAVPADQPPEEALDRPPREASARSARPAPPSPRQTRTSTGTSTGRATAILAGGTFASRVTGFIRVLVIGYVLGVSSLSDAFNYANGIPNIVYDLLLGGILSATLIPVFVEHLDDEDDERRSRSISAVLTAITVALVLVCGVLWLVAPWVIRFYLLLNPHSTGPAERALAVRLLRYFAPQVFFLGVIVASTALLNARRRFAAGALSPVVNNVIAIAALIATKFAADQVLTSKTLGPAGVLSAFAKDDRAVLILGIGTTAGYAVQLLVQVPAMHHLGLRLRPVWDMRHPAVRRVAGLSTWLIGVVVANQASLALVMILAGQKSGGLTAYQFGYQFFQLPYALIAASVASAIMPDLADRWVSGQRMAFERRLVTGLRVTLAVLIPVSLVYMAVAQPFIQLAIHHGRVSQSGAHLLTSTLVLFAVGLPGFSAFFMLMRAYQAMQDTRAMFRIYAAENVLTVICALVLEPLMGVPGLALAWVGPYTVASVWAVVRLKPRVGSLGGWLTVRALMRVAVVSAITVGLVVALGLPFRGRTSDAWLLVRLVVQLGAGAVVYVYLGRAFGVRELKLLLGLARRMMGR